MDEKPVPPEGLQARGLRFWQSAMDAFDLEADERELLVEIARELDTAEELAAVLVRDGLIVEGSVGQPRVHPAAGELRASRLAIGRLLAQLGLPDANDDSMDSPVQARGRLAARARWTARDAKQARRGA